MYCVIATYDTYLQNIHTQNTCTHTHILYIRTPTRLYMYIYIFSCIQNLFSIIRSFAKDLNVNLKAYLGKSAAEVFRMCIQDSLGHCKVIPIMPWRKQKTNGATPSTSSGQPMDKPWNDLSRPWKDLLKSWKDLCRSWTGAYKSLNMGRSKENEVRENERGFRPAKR